MIRLLIIEDDVKLCLLLKQQLEKEGYIADTCQSGSDALFYTSQQVYDCIILDRMLPEIDGLSLVHNIRKRGITTPIIMETALNGINDKIDGLDAGADDYITKPYEIKELLARIRALLRRPQEIVTTDCLIYSNLILDLKNKTLSTSTATCKLGRKELDLLEFFFRNKEKILDRDLILTRVWGPDSFSTGNNLDTYISFVRRRLKYVHSNAQITMIYSVGYRLEECHVS